MQDVVARHAFLSLVGRRPFAGLVAKKVCLHRLRSTTHMFLSLVGRRPFAGLSCQKAWEIHNTNLSQPEVPL